MYLLWQFPLQYCCLFHNRDKRPGIIVELDNILDSRTSRRRFQESLCRLLRQPTNPTYNIVVVIEGTASSEGRFVFAR